MIPILKRFILQSLHILENVFVKMTLAMENQGKLVDVYVAFSISIDPILPRVVSIPQIRFDILLFLKVILFIFI